MDEHKSRGLNEYFLLILQDIKTKVESEEFGGQHKEIIDGLLKKLMKLIKSKQSKGQDSLVRGLGEAVNDIMKALEKKINPRQPKAERNATIDKPKLTEHRRPWFQLVRHSQQADHRTFRVPRPDVKIGRVQVEGEVAGHHLLPEDVVVTKRQGVGHLCAGAI